MQDVASNTVSKYGVGSCGPRGFYGTIDVHLDLEKQIASFMGCPECTIFAYDIATVASVIPACANRKEWILILFLFHILLANLVLTKTLYGYMVVVWIWVHGSGVDMLGKGLGLMHV